MLDAARRRRCGSPVTRSGLHPTQAAYGTPPRAEVPRCPFARVDSDPDGAISLFAKAHQPPRTGLARQLLLSGNSTLRMADG